MNALRGANLALAFAVELAMLAALALWALTLDLPEWLRWIVAAVAVAAVAVAWGRWAAPRSTRRLSEPGLTLFKLVLFALAAAALLMARQPEWALGFALVAVANLALVHVLGPMRS